jgi:hypothetical protein
LKTNVLKNILVAFITGFVLLTGTGAQAAALVEAKFTPGSDSYVCGDRSESMDVAPFIENGRVYVPVRYLAGAVGVHDDLIVWDGENGIVTLTRPDQNVKVGIKLGEKVLFRNDDGILMDVPPLLVDDRVFLPARYIAESFGYSVDWDGTGTVVIKKDDGININVLKAEIIDNIKHIDVEEFLKKEKLQYIINNNQLILNNNIVTFSYDESKISLSKRDGLNMDMELNHPIVFKNEKWFISEIDFSKLVLLVRICML